MIKFIGECIINLYIAVKYMAEGRLRLGTVLSNAAIIGYDSLPMALSIVIIAAAVISLQVSKQFLQSGAETYIGGFLAIAMIRELAPGFAALAISARAGTAISAEVANMKVTSQVDAIKVLKVDPIGYYFAPRILAGAISVPATVILAELLGIIGGMIVSYFTIGLHPDLYFRSVWLMIKVKDIFISVFKGFLFGVVISTVCATQGYSTEGGAKNVGISTTKAAVRATVILLAVDLIVALLFYF